MGRRKPLAEFSHRREGWRRFPAKGRQPAKGGVGSWIDDRPPLKALFLLMANTASAAKQARAALRRREVNRRLLDTARRAQKQLLALITSGKKAEASKLFPELQRRLDRAAKGKAIHRNRSARIKSRIAHLLR
ncbi:MAG: 30S ribosomal protein S20 [Verrucomicrobia bacterium]|nr:30S ribosomal protein S20 [Verrucomicrobiota bacterium]